MSHVTQLPEWKNLMAQSTALRSMHLRELFAKDPARFQTFHLNLNGLLVDYSRQRIDAALMNALQACLKAQHFDKKRADLFFGKNVNESENRPALHMALRAQAGDRFSVNGVDVVGDVVRERQRAFDFAEKIRNRQFMGATGKPITTIVHVGIGGSDLGPRLLAHAFADDKAPVLHFVSNVDPVALQKVMRACDPAQTLVVIASKTFTTAETLRNAHTLRSWLAATLGDANANRHCAALTAAPEAAKAFGISAEHMFLFWDWVGGRFSVHSIIGLPAMLSMGAAAFEAFLSGAREMDAHFQNAPLSENVPVLLALLDAWNGDGLGINARAILPYTESLALLPEYLAQLEMESLGKDARPDSAASHASAAVVFGATGTPAQHAFMQALHQGASTIASGIFVVKRDGANLPAHTHMLQANALAQAQALAFGKDDKDTYKICPGNRPVTLFVMDALTPAVLGKLVALFEHKVFTLGVLWDINPFDQWGVELGKKLATPLEQALAGNSDAGDAQLAPLLAYFKK